jgi:hypothetical protein
MKSLCASAARPFGALTFNQQRDASKIGASIGPKSWCQAATKPSNRVVTIGARALRIGDGSDDRFHGAISFLLERRCAVDPKET